MMEVIMRIQLKTFFVPAVSFFAGVMAMSLAVDIKNHGDYAEQLHRNEELKKAELLGAKEQLHVKRFMVSVDEVRNNLVFAERFQGSYHKTFRMSDGSERTLRLQPLIRQNERVLALEDNGKMTYMGMNGTTTNGTLMVQVRELND